jgi:hypothetical protein
LLGLGAPAAATVQPDIADITRRYAALGYALTPYEGHPDRYVVRPIDGSRPGIANMQWHDALSTLEVRERQAREADPTTPPLGALADDLTAPDSPLTEIAAALSNIGTVLAERPDMDDAEITANLAELRALSDEMDALSDAPDLDDDEYEAVTHAISRLARELRELRQEQRAVAG